MMSTSSASDISYHHRRRCRRRQGQCQVPAKSVPTRRLTSYLFTLLALPSSTTRGAFIPNHLSFALRRCQSQPSSSSSTSVSLARGGRRVKPADDHDDIMHYLAQSEARAGGGLGFEYPNHPHARHHQQRGNSNGVSSPPSRSRGKKKYVEYEWSPTDKLKKTQVKTMVSERTMSTALCIVPDDEHWDSLQRARFMARDHTYQRWPPAIRLFHPFAPRAQLPNAATAIADIIERHNIEPFEVTLDQLLILPHFEVLDEQMDAEAEMVRRHAYEEKEERISAEEEIRREAREQIEEESRISLERKKRRKPWRRRKPLADMATPPNATANGDASGGSKQSNTNTAESAAGDRADTPRNTTNGEGKNTPSTGSTSDISPRTRSTNANLSPQELLDKQRAAKSEFNGPCVVCLEPNDASKRKLEEVREILRTELFGAYDPFSASSGVSSTNNLPRAIERKHKKLYKGFAAKKGKGGASFRPVLALARFPSVTAAVEAAKKLQALWEPLTFSVTDLSIISRSDGDGPEDSYRFSKSGSEVSVRRIQGTEFETESALLSSKGRFGCDAVISLIGAEVVEEGVVAGDEEILDLLLSEAGEAGGAEAKLDYEDLLALSDEEEHIRKRQARVRFDDDDDELEDSDEETEEDWDHWLMDDDEWDEGATIVIGRTQFFMGEARQYVGMPAMSATDGRDRVLGEGISAAARRKGTVHRKGDRWNEGDFGRKEKDIRG